MVAAGLIERALCRVFRFTDIEHEGSLYMRRWFLTGKRSDGWELVLHKICRPDADAACHNHPGDFATLVLRGGYLEEVMQVDGSKFMDAVVAGDIRFRSADFAHRIERIFGGAAWTLCLRRRATNQWGFWVPDSEYNGGQRFVQAEQYFRPGYDRAAAPERAP